MKGLLEHSPREFELERLYYELAQVGAPSIGRKRAWRYRVGGKEELLALAGEMLRYDPRLLSVLLQLVLQQWRDLNPVVLRGQMHAMRWPQALLVVLEFAKLASADPELAYFCNHLMAGWPRIETPERFFIDSARPGSRMAARGLGRNLAPYARWGFVGSERPTIDMVTKQTVGRYDAATRRRILHDLVEQTGELSLSEYLEAVDHAISRQQARLDLLRCPDLVSTGHGRGAKWRKREPGNRHTRGTNIRRRA